MSYFEKWSLEKPSLLAKTKSATLYKVERDSKQFVLKLYTETGKTSEGKGAAALELFGGSSSVLVEERDEDALLMEYISGKSLKEEVTSQSDHIFLELLKKLHQVATDQLLEFDSMERRYQSLLRRGTTDSFFKEGAVLAEKLLKEQSVKILLHGDLHHTNILYSDKRGWLAIDPQPLIGDPLYDIGNYFYNPDDNVTVTEDIKSIKKRLWILSQGLEVDEKRVLEFAIVHGHLSSSWQLDIGEDPVRRIRILEKLKSLS